MKSLVLLVFSIFILCRADPPVLKTKVQNKSYVCPPDFIRLSHRCYYFSKYKMTWNDAFFNCKDLHGNLAIIRNRHQSKLITKTLNASSEKLDRWLGGKYDFRHNSWLWAASGKALEFKNFQNTSNEVKEENLNWHCMFADPNFGYRWNYDNCLKKKNFICHTKIRKVSKKGIKKLRRQFNNKLNETPIPVISKGNTGTTKENDVGNLKADYFRRPNKSKRNQQNRRRPDSYEVIEKRFKNGTASLSFDLPHKHNKRNRRKNSKEEPLREVKSLDKEVRWKSYYKDSKNPLHPRPIIEEYAFSKELI